MKVSLVAVATSKRHNSWWPLSIFNGTDSEKINESALISENGIVKIWSLPSKLIPVYVVLSANVGSVSVTLRILGFDVLSLSKTPLKAGDNVPINFSWNGQTLKGNLTVS